MQKVENKTESIIDFAREEIYFRGGWISLNFSLNLSKIDAKS